VDYLDIAAMVMLAMAIGVVFGAYIEQPKRDKRGRFTK
jgi:ABC-type arginine transport system permease subunit